MRRAADWCRCAIVRPRRPRTADRSAAAPPPAACRAACSFASSAADSPLRFFIHIVFALLSGGGQLAFLTASRPPRSSATMPRVVRLRPRPLLRTRRLSSRASARRSPRASAAGLAPVASICRCRRLGRVILTRLCHALLKAARRLRSRSASPPRARRCSTRRSFSYQPEKEPEQQRLGDGPHQHRLARAMRSCSARRSSSEAAVAVGADRASSTRATPVLHAPRRARPPPCRACAHPPRAEHGAPCSADARISASSPAAKEQGRRSSSRSSLVAGSPASGGAPSTFVQINARRPAASRQSLVAHATRRRLVQVRNPLLLLLLQPIDRLPRAASSCRAACSFAFSAAARRCAWDAGGDFCPPAAAPPPPPGRRRFTRETPAREHVDRLLGIAFVLCAFPRQCATLITSLVANRLAPALVPSCRCRRRSIGVACHGLIARARAGPGNTRMHGFVCSTCCFHSSRTSSSSCGFALLLRERPPPPCARAVRVARPPCGRRGRRRAPARPVASASSARTWASLSPSTVTRLRSSAARSTCSRCLPLGQRCFRPPSPEARWMVTPRRSPVRRAAWPPLDSIWRRQY